MFRIDLEPGVGDRDGVGGRPYLRGAWPTCANAECKRTAQPLTHFVRFDIREEWQTGLPAGSHFSLFQCVGCCDAFIPPDGKPPWTMPAKFWESRDRNYLGWHASIEPPGAPLLRAAEPDPLLVEQKLLFVPDEKQAPFVGGEMPQLKTTLVCGCSAPMNFVALFPATFRFITKPGSPEQAGVYSSKKYSLFVGNTVIFFGCSKGCDPRALVPLNQG